MNPSYLILFASVTIASFAQILLKCGALKNYATFLRQYLNVYVISGYGLTFFSLFLTTLAYRGLEYKVVPMIESLGFILVMLLSRIFFKEKLTVKKICGTCIILAGICIYYI